MTCRERLKIEHPELVNPVYCAGCKGCPDDYGYLDTSETCYLDTCAECWDREANDSVTEVNTIKNLFEELENTIMHPNWGSWEQRVDHFEELKKRYIGE